MRAFFRCLVWFFFFLFIKKVIFDQTIYCTSNIQNCDMSSSRLHGLWFQLLPSYAWVNSPHSLGNILGFGRIGPCTTGVTWGSCLTFMAAPNDSGFLCSRILVLWVPQGGWIHLPAQGICPLVPVSHLIWDEALCVEAFALLVVRVLFGPCTWGKDFYS